MAKLPKVDVVTVGAGWTAGILAQQLTKAGLQVVSLEQGPLRTTDGNFSHDHDELRYQVRRDMMVDLQQETWTWRPSPKDAALPMRQYGSFNPGKGVGGAGIHWAAQSWRFYPSDFQYRSHHIQRYGENKLPAGNRIQDWPITYDDLEPYYDAWVLAYLAVTHVSVALPGRFFPHYYQLWLPPLILAASWAVAGGPRLSLWVGAAAVLLLVLQVRDLRRGLDEWSRIANPVPQPALDARPLARALRSRMPDCEFGLNIGSEVGLYFYGQFRPATGLFYKNHINTVASLRDDLLNRLRSSDRYRPCFVAYFRQSLESDETLRPRVANLIDRLQLERDERLSTGLFEVYLRGKESPLATEPGTR